MECWSKWIVHESYFQILRMIVLLIAAACSKPDLGLKSDARKPWKASDRQVGSVLPMVFIMDRRPKLFHGVHTIFRGLLILLFSYEVIPKVGCMGRIFPGMEMSALWEFVSATRCGKVGFKLAGLHKL